MALGTGVAVRNLAIQTETEPGRLKSYPIEVRTMAAM
jgi:hypothetical protein